MIKLIIGCFLAAGALYANAQNFQSAGGSQSYPAGGEGKLASAHTGRESGARKDERPAPRHARDAHHERALPGARYSDAAGRSTSLDEIKVGGNWVLIVLDASMPSAKEFLSALSAKQEDLDERTAILLVGSDASIEQLSDEKQKLSGIRWMTSSDASAIKALELKVVPSMMGMRSNQKIAWKFSGVPSSPEKAVSMIRNWLRLNPAVASRE